MPDDQPSQKSPFSTFFPGPSMSEWTKVFTAPSQMQTIWLDSMSTGMHRATDFWAEVTRMETATVERMSAGIDEWAKLMKESLHYQLQLQSEMRRLFTEASEQLASFKRGED